MAFFSNGAPRRTVTAPVPADTTTAVLDSAHVGDIVGALGTIRRHDTAEGRSRRQRFRMLLAVIGPGLIVMVGDNDAGGMATYAQAGQNYGMALMWTLVLLIPVLYVNQEMVVRLGAVAGVGHARLIFARFGKFWGAFSVGDLFVVNALTIVTEFIGVSMALGYFGLPKQVSVPVAAVLLFAVVAGGSFRRWERFLLTLIAINIVMFPLAFMVHPSVSATARGLIPSFPGGLNSTLLLIIVAIVGTTVAPWQLFFQQSNIVDKRITPRWIRYERVDLWVGIVVVMIGAVAIMAATAFGLGPAGRGAFSDAGAVAHGLSAHLGTTVGAMFAILLLDASLIGANAVGLATTYTLGDTLGKRHSLHWKMSEAPAFYAGYALLLAAAAAVAFSPDHVLGLLTQGVQALAGVLLPSATVFLVLLCNDKAVLGPWVNTTRQNIVAGIIVWALVLLSLALTAATFFPHLSTASLELGFGIGAAIGLLGGVALAVTRHRGERRGAERTAAELGGLDPDQIEELDSTPLSRQERKSIVAADRYAWRTPQLDDLERPNFSPLRTAGMIALRGYLALAVVLVVVKIVQQIGG
ncbi:NRAMP family divalent metal transporter [Nocardia vaccinii]|uniref:NRAMP family divalent metal transporter n=1 Tax=Nocardia vaccinii TaxID=1822 RepID=UPI000829DF57|nr:NRAMP family divalent metal transporter [Nocardia vaccinii]